MASHCVITTSVAINPDVAGTIIKQAQSITDEGTPFYDLITLATHGRTGFKRAMLGSVTEHVFGATALPLLVICPPVAQSGAKHIEAAKEDEVSQSWVGLF